MGVCLQLCLNSNYAGTESVTQVPVHWGIHEDVYCAVSLPASASCRFLMHPQSAQLHLAVR